MALLSLLRFSSPENHSSKWALGGMAYFSPTQNENGAIHNWTHSLIHTIVRKRLTRYFPRGNFCFRRFAPAFVFAASFLFPMTDFDGRSNYSRWGPFLLFGKLNGIRRIIDPQNGEKVIPFFSTAGCDRKIKIKEAIQFHYWVCSVRTNLLCWIMNSRLNG